MHAESSNKGGSNLAVKEMKKQHLSGFINLSTCLPERVRKGQTMPSRSLTHAVIQSGGKNEV
jgi:hypothetical protein